jgi:molybdenum cofactor synthesis domain-containing protein
MRPLKSLISLEEGLRLGLGAVSPVSRTETPGVLAAAGRVTAADIVSAIPVPLVDRAAMDGYAVRAADTFGAGRFRPKTLRCVETLYADTVPRKRVAAGQCVQVATGSSIPKGADAVVMVEHTERDGGEVQVLEPVHPGEHISRQGEDIRAGEVVVRRGERLTPAKVGALTAVGLERVAVYAKPRVAILATGDEVLAPGRKIRPGQVYDINSYTLAAVVEQNGGEPVRRPGVADTLPALRSALRSAVREDLVVFSGGSSVGEKDMIMDVLQDMGELLFHGIAVKPGKPTVLGTIGKTAVLGMPGYPTSCLSNAYLILAPMLRKMARLPPEPQKVIELPLARKIVSVVGRVEFHTVRVEDGMAVPAYKESGAITSMAHADGYVQIPANVDLIEKGERVRVVLF